MHRPRCIRRVSIKDVFMAAARDKSVARFFTGKKKHFHVETAREWLHLPHFATDCNLPQLYPASYFFASAFFSAFIPKSPPPPTHTHICATLTVAKLMRSTYGTWFLGEGVINFVTLVHCGHPLQTSPGPAWPSVTRVDLLAKVVAAWPWSKCSLLCAKLSTFSASYFPSPL